MKAIVLSSGSKGNTTYIECGKTKILIDMGNTSKYVVSKLEGIGVKAEEIDAIFITHTHVDHVKGLKVFLKKYNTKVYFTPKMLDELSYIENYHLIEQEKIHLADLVVHVIKTSHDTVDSVGYIVEGDSRSIVYITDTGYIHQRYFPILSNREMYILESNHDIEMLNHGKYSFALRQRILGDKGHLSNYDCSRYLSSFIGDKTRCIVLAHLSEENNTSKLAYDTLMERLEENQQSVEKILIAKQDEETEEVFV